MTEQFICPATNKPCPTGDLCASVNEPLQGAVPHIRQEVGGLAWSYAKKALINNLDAAGDLVTADFHPAVNRNGDAAVCPQDVIKGDFGKKHGERMAKQAVRGILAEAVTNLIVDLRAQKERRRQ